MATSPLLRVYAFIQLAFCCSFLGCAAKMSQQTSVSPARNARVQFVEISAEIDSNWHSKDRTGKLIERPHHFTARCVVSTNTWLIEGNFLANAKVTYWFTGSNIVEHTVITQDVPGPDRLGTPKRGERFTKTHNAPDGRPTGQGVANVVWLAFCSGPYLRTDAREIPMPIGPPEHAFGFSDKAVVFEDSFGLPKSVQLYGASEKLACRYRVLQSTNLNGWSFPLQFEVTQYASHGKGHVHDGSRSELVGRVISIRRAIGLGVPTEVQSRRFEIQ